MHCRYWIDTGKKCDTSQYTKAWYKCSVCFLFIYSVIWFSIYWVLWIRSTAPDVDIITFVKDTPWTSRFNCHSIFEPQFLLFDFLAACIMPQIFYWAAPTLSWWWLLFSPCIKGTRHLNSWWLLKLSLNV